MSILLHAIPIVALILGIIATVILGVICYDLYAAGIGHWDENKTLARIEKFAAVIFMLCGLALLGIDFYGVLVFFK